MRIVVIEDGLLLPSFEPPVAWHLAVVLVGHSVATFPGVELARAESQPTQESPRRQFGANGPVLDSA